MKNKQNTSKMRAYSKYIIPVLTRGFNSLNAKILEPDFLFFTCVNENNTSLKLHNA